MDGHPKIRSSRHCGVILALDLDIETTRYGNVRDELMAFFMDRGVFLRPLGSTVYLMPPYVIAPAELQKLYTTLELLLDTCKRVTPTYARHGNFYNVLGFTLGPWFWAGGELASV